MEAAGKRWIVHGSRSNEFTIWNLSDLHLMSRACAEEQIAADIEAIRSDPCAFWLGGGDYCEFIGPLDKRFDADSVAEWVSVKDLGNIGEAGIRHAAKLFQPIKHKCLGLLTGNHEKAYEHRTEHEGMHGWLCMELGVPNLQYSAIMDVVFCRKTGVKAPYLSADPPGAGGDAVRFRVFCHHGAGFASTPGGKLNKLIQFMQSFEADIFFCGHVHDKVGRREPSMGVDDDCKKLVARERLGVISGSYLKTYAQGVTTYGEQRGYRPVSLGAAWVKVSPSTGKMNAEI